LRLCRYIEALGDAGARGEPLWLPSHGDLSRWAEHLSFRLDGLVISGGADLPPPLYGEEPRADANLDIVTPARPDFESALLGAFIEKRKPVLGICYGCQFLNIWHGGSLIQDIPTLWPNPIRHDNNVLHCVCLERDSKLHRIIGMDEFEVCSQHHQAIARVAEEGRVTAWAPDHSPEGLEFREAPFLLGVQWHPERTRESLATQRLFGALVAACSDS
jgi:putative glutamine amidotransferase